jgi:hypothetical protein
MARVASGRGWGRRIGVEATPRSQPNQDLRAALLKPLLQFDGLVARVEDEQGDRCGFFLGQAAEQPLNLLYGYHVSILRRRYALDVHRGSPALADEVELGDELVSPTGHDRLASRVA